MAAIGRRSFFGFLFGAAAAAPALPASAEAMRTIADCAIADYAADLGIAKKALYQTNDPLEIMAIGDRVRFLRDYPSKS